MGGDQPTTALAAGVSFNDIYVTPDTTALGANSETLTFSLNDVKKSGYDGVLPDQTLTVDDTIVAPAAAKVLNPSIDLGEDHVGDATAPPALEIVNAATTGAANLDVTPVAGAAVTTTGGVSGLAVGTQDDGVTASLTSQTAGIATGVVTLDAYSDLGDGGQVPALPRTRPSN